MKTYIYLMPIGDTDLGHLDIKDEEFIKRNLKYPISTFIENLNYDLINIDNYYFRLIEH